MSDDLFLFLIIAVFYLVDCFFWVRRNSFAFVLSFWPVKNPGFTGHYWGNRTGGFYFINPFPPLSSLFICQSLPLLFSADVIARAPMQQDSELLRHEDIDTVETDSTKLLINGSLFAYCGSSQAARFLTDLIEKLKKLKQKDRLAAIGDTINDTLDTNRTEQDIDQFLLRSRILRILSSLMWIYLFVFSPMILWLFGPIWLLPLLTGAVLLFHIPIVIFFYRTHRSFFPELKDERQSQLIKIMFFPPAALRAIDYISSNLLYKYHPLAAAFVMCNRKQFSAFAVRVIRDLKFPVRLDILTGERKTADEQYRRQMIAAVKLFLDNRGLSIEEMLETGFAPDTPGLTYCPRCLCEYIIPSGHCVDCPGVELLPISRAGPASS